MTTSTDNRMAWILQVEECKKAQNKEFYYTEYEICSEVRIPGPLDYENGAVFCGLLEEKNRQGLYTYLLKIKHIEKEYEFDKEKYSTEGYFFKEGLVGELLAIFSVYFQARFYLKTRSSGVLSSASVKFRHRHEFNYKRPNKYLNYEMFTNQNRNWAYDDGLKKFLNVICSIDGKYHQSLIHSFYWYSEAVKEIGDDDELFFIKMVSCVESLIKYVELEVDALENKVINLISEEYFGRRQGAELESWLKNRKIGERFSLFFLEYSKGFFKGGSRKASHCYIYRPDLMKFVKRIYNARSKLLHEGAPMFLSMEMYDDGSKYWDQDLSLGMMADRKRFKGNEKLPRMRWFERIVNHCLKSFIMGIIGSSID